MQHENHVTSGKGDGPRHLEAMEPSKTWLKPGFLPLRGKVPMSRVRIVYKLCSRWLPELDLPLSRNTSNGAAFAKGSRIDLRPQWSSVESGCAQISLKKKEICVAPLRLLGVLRHFFELPLTSASQRLGFAALRTGWASKLRPWI